MNVSSYTPSRSHANEPVTVTVPFAVVIRSLSAVSSSASSVVRTGQSFALLIVTPLCAVTITFSASPVHKVSSVRSTYTS